MIWIHSRTRLYWAISFISCVWLCEDIQVSVQIRSNLCCLILSIVIVRTKREKKTKPNLLCLHTVHTDSHALNRILSDFSGFLIRNCIIISLGKIFSLIHIVFRCLFVCGMCVYQFSDFHIRLLLVKIFGDKKQAEMIRFFYGRERTKKHEKGPCICL